MSGLVEFLRARLAEDERKAQESNDPDNLELYVRRLSDDVRHPIYIGAGRLLREVERDRRMLELHAPAEMEYVDGDVCMTCEARGEGPHYPCQTLRLLALPYADHPDYREEWKP